MAVERKEQVDQYNDLIWKIIEAKILYYQPDADWTEGFADGKMPTDAQYDELEKQYLTLCRELGEENSLVHKGYPGFEDIPGDGMMEIDWEDPDVQEIYQALTEEYREWKRKNLKKPPKKKEVKAKRPPRDQWDVWEGCVYPDDIDVWRKTVYFLAHDYHHAMIVMQIEHNNAPCQVFTPALEDDELKMLKRTLKKEIFIIDKVEGYRGNDEKGLD